MFSHINYAMDNTVKNDVWGPQTARPSGEKHHHHEVRQAAPGPAHHSPVAYVSSKGGKYAPEDRCCTVCASGLFLPREMTDSIGEGAVLPDSAAGLSKEELEGAKRYARKKLERFEDEVKLRNHGKTSYQVVPDLPLLQSEEVKLGKKYGKGGSASVYEVTSFNLGATPLDAHESVELTPTDDDDVEIINSSSQKHLRQALTGSFPQKDRFVLKKLSTQYQQALLKDDPYAKACAINLVLEAQILRMLDHPNVLKLHAMGVREQVEPFLILTCLPESMEQRILHWRGQVRKHKKQLAHSAASMWRLVSVGGSNKKVYAAHLKLRKLLWERMHVARDIALAVDHMHSKDIAYRDLKCSNIGFDSSGVVKIFDFGISRFLPRTEQQEPVNEEFLMSIAGTKMYMAPEVAAKKAYGFKADVYSFGVMLWQLLSVSTPKPRETDEFPPFDFPMCACWPVVTQDLVGSLMDPKATLRPTMKAAHEELTAQLEKLKRAFTQQDSVPVLSKKKRGFGRQGTFELSTDLDMP